jgi:hypothetical protein
MKALGTLNPSTFFSTAPPPYNKEGTSGIEDKDGSKKLLTYFHETKDEQVLSFQETYPSESTIGEDVVTMDIIPLPTSHPDNDDIVGYG